MTFPIINISIENVLLAISCLTAFVLSTVMILRSRIQSSIFLALSTFGVFLWIFFEIVFLNAKGVFYLTLAAKSLHITGAIIITNFLFFTYTFFKPDLRNNKLFLFGNTALFALMIILLVFTNQIIGITRYSYSHSISYGPLYSLYALYMVFVAFLGFYYLVKKSLNVRDNIERQQLIYVGFGAIVSIAIGVILNIILIYFDRSAHYWIGPFLAIIYVIFAAYAVFKHHLFNIEVISTELFSALIVIIVLIDALLAKTKSEFILKLGLLAGIAVISFLLIRSVFKEILAKEKIARISEDLRAANIKLQEINEAKSEFVSLVSHQIRTPLTSIKGLTSMLMEDFWGPLSGDQKKSMMQIYSSEERLLALIENLLDITRIEAGREVFNLQLVDLSEIAKGVIQELRPQAEAKGLYLCFAEQKIPLVNSDSLKIRQVIQNLIENAIKYTPKGGVSVSFKKEADAVVFSVADTGLGIVKEQQPFLFEKFERGKGAASRYVGGTGLGLYWAAKIIGAHKGKIWVESEGENKGSAFFFSLPVIE